jgi:hypothetical protein
MPIHLNLLAEAQAAEEMRRRDPVKRALWLGSLMVVAMLVWAASVYFKTLVVKHGLSQIETEIARRTNDYRLVLDNQRKADDIKRKLGSLRQLATNRFLQGNLLNALQHVTLEDVQLMRVKVDQVYVPTEEVKAKTNSEGYVTPGKLATAKEAIVVTLEARDATPKPGEPGDQVNKFMDTVRTNAYFQSSLRKTNAVKLAYRGPVTSLPDARPFLLFTIECYFPEKKR